MQFVVLRTRGLSGGVCDHQANLTAYSPRIGSAPVYAFAIHWNRSITNEPTRGTNSHVNATQSCISRFVGTYDARALD